MSSDIQSVDTEKLLNMVDRWFTFELRAIQHYSSLWRCLDCNSTGPEDSIPHDDWCRVRGYALFTELRRRGEAMEALKEDYKVQRDYWRTHAQDVEDERDALRAEVERLKREREGLKVRVWNTTLNYNGGVGNGEKAADYITKKVFDNEH